MKRTANKLQQERGDAERDARLRRQIEADAEAAERAERVAKAQSTKAKALDAARQHWKQENIISASNYAVKDPAQNPLGTCSQLTLCSRSPPFWPSSL